MKKFPLPLKIVLTVLAVFVTVRLLILAGAIGLLLFDAYTSKPEVYTDVTHYREYMSFDAGQSDMKWNKWGMDETIWPQRISGSMKVADFKMVYYDPFDKQYLGYLVVDYPKEEYLLDGFDAAQNNEYMKQMMANH